MRDSSEQNKNSERNKKLRELVPRLLAKMVQRDELVEELRDWYVREVENEGLEGPEAALAFKLTKLEHLWQTRKDIDARIRVLRDEVAHLRLVLKLPKTATLFPRKKRNKP